MDRKIAFLQKTAKKLVLSAQNAYFSSEVWVEYWACFRGYHDNEYYRGLNTRWLKADKLFWSLALTDQSKPVRWSDDDNDNNDDDVDIDIIFTKHYILSCGLSKFFYWILN